MEKVNLVFFIIVGLVFSPGKSWTQDSNLLLITEIFADPTPSQGLPEKEYIEVFNNTAVEIQLSDYRLFYSNTNVRFPDFVLLPNAYVIVCRNGNGSEFQKFGSVLELSKLSLLNSGTKLQIKKNSGEPISTVDYKSNWYTPGKQEGFALEMIDLNFPCVGFGNWASSTATIGGTPGSKNSVAASNPDIVGPELLNFSLIDQVLTLNFNEKLSSSIDVEFFEFLPIQEIDSFSFDADLFSISVFFQNKISSGEIVELTLSGISDCSGNVSEPIKITLSNIPFPSSNDLAISEILFDPYPGGEDFFEVKNIGTQSVNIAGLKVYNRNSSGNLSSGVELLSGQNVVLAPDSIACFTTNKSQLIQTYKFSNSAAIFQVSRLPAFPNETGEIILLNQEDEVIEELNYNSSWHFSSIDDPEGVSLERVDFLSSALFQENWRSTSGAYAFATPGIETKQSQESNSISISPKIITPDGDNVDDILKFDFSGLKESKNVTIRIYNKSGIVINEVISNLYITPSSELEWDPSIVSSRLPTGYYFAFIEVFSQNSRDNYKLPFVIAYRN